MKRNKGISLIVLVITIIVMIILAGAIILSLNNAGIIGKANQAVEKTNVNQVQTLAQLKWSEAYLDKNIKTDEEYNEAVKKALQEEGIDTTKYVIVVTATGVEVVDGWIQEGLKVRKGNVVLNVGDDINYEYDEKVEGVKEGIKWKVLGANNKGELLILSTSLIGELELGNSTNTIKCQNDWLTLEKQLDNLCEPYVHGKNVVSARSVRIEDIDNVMEYNKTTYGKGEMYEYGADITFIYNGPNKVNFVVSNNARPS